MSYRLSDAGSPILVVAFHGNLVAANPRTGARIWQLSLGDTQNVVRIAIAEDHIFALAHQKLCCIEYLTGSIRWAVEVYGDTLLVEGNMAFVGGLGTVDCYSTVDGSPLWKDEYKGLGATSVALGVPGNVVQADRG
jgi:outer membrane protein assembly factor BamB